MPSQVLLTVLIACRAGHRKAQFCAEHCATVLAVQHRTVQCCIFMSVATFQDTSVAPGHSNAVQCSEVLTTQHAV